LGLKKNTRRLLKKGMERATIEDRRIKRKKTLEKAGRRRLQ